MRGREVVYLVSLEFLSYMAQFFLLLYSLRDELGLQSANFFLSLSSLTLHFGSVLPERCLND